MTGEATPGPSLASSTSGFTLVALLPSFAMLGGLAVIARDTTLEEWSALSVGASVGAFTGLAALFGWRLVGPVQVARCGPTERRSVYAQSLVDRLVLLGVLLGPMSVLAVAVADSSESLLALGMAWATSLTALSAVWFGVGVGEPWLLLRRETWPKVLATLVGAAAVGAGLPVVVFPAGIGLGAVFGCVAVSRHVLSGRRVGWASALRRTRGSLGSQRRAAASELAAGGYTVAAVAVVAAASSPAVTAVFASGDRLFRASLIPVSALASALLPAVSATVPSGSRVRRTAVSMALLGAAGLVGTALLGPVVSRSLFGPRLEVPPLAALAYGVAFLAVAVNTTLGRHVLVPQGRLGVVLAATTTGAVVGTVALVVGAQAGGVRGAVLGLAVGELAVVAVMAAALATPRRRQVPLAGP